MLNQRFALFFKATAACVLGGLLGVVALASSSPSDGPALVPKISHAELGQPTAGQAFTYVYVLNNESDRTVNIHRITQTVKWVTLKLYGPKGLVSIDENDQGATELKLAPKESGRIYLKVETSDLSGDQAGEIILHSDDEPNTTKLSFEMTVKEPTALDIMRNAPAPTTTNPTAPSQPTGPLPKIHFGEYEHDFGSMLAGEKQTTTFSFENQGEGPLEISKVYASCGCLATTLRAADEEIPISELNTGRRVLSLKNGEAAEIDITIDTKGLMGPVNRKIRVYSNDSTKNPVYLSLKCSAEQAYSMEPRNLRFTPIMRRETVTRSVTFTPTKLEGCEITECIPPASYVKVDWIKTDAALGAVRNVPSYRIDVTISEDAPVGNIMKPIIVKTTHEKIPELQIPLFARILPEVSFRSSSPNNPEKIEFGVIMKAEDVSKDLEISNANPSIPLEVTGLEVLSRYKDQVKAEIITLDPGVKFILRLTALKSLDARYFQGVIRLTTNHPDLPTKDLAFHGWIKR